MAIETAGDLIQSLRNSGLFTSEKVLELIHVLDPLGDDPQVLMKYLVKEGWLSAYQIRKIVNGKAAELTLGQYLIVDKLGEGGMGRVYRAVQSRVGREVALKVVRPNLVANPIVKARYNREVQASSSLNHPNIVSVFDAGEADGKFYLAMEFVDGVDLSRLVRAHGLLSVQEACEYIRQAALGLHHAHEQGFVHRDIKPSNIVVSGERYVPDATEPARVRILDMGLVREIGFEEGGSELTRDGTVVGTPDYMAPEQAKNSKGVDARADLYGLGCTFFLLLTGKPPFPDGTPIEKLIKHQLDPLPPIQAQRPDVPGELAQLIAEMMAKKPEQRPQSAKEVADRLEAFTHYPPDGAPAYIPPRPAADRLVGVTAPTPQFGPGSSTQDSRPQNATSPRRTAAAELSTPVQASDPTPRPALVPTQKEVSPFDFPLDPPSPVPMAAERSSRVAVKPPTPHKKMWLVVAVVAVWIGVAVVLIWVAAKAFSSKSPAQSSSSTPTGLSDQPGDMKPPVRTAAEAPNPAGKHEPILTEVADGAGLVVVCYPGNYLKMRSPFSRGQAAGKIEQQIDYLYGNSDARLNVADRVVLSIVPDSPYRFLAVSEAGFVTKTFAEKLDKNPRLKADKSARNQKVYSFNAGSMRFAAITNPQSYTQASRRELLVTVLKRNEQGPKPATGLEPGMTAALGSSAENSPPLLLAVASGAMVLPFQDRPKLAHLGIDLIVGKARIVGDKMECEVAITGESQKTVADFLLTLTQSLRSEYRLSGPALIDMIKSAERVNGTDGARYQLKLRATWTPEQFLGWLERVLG